MRNATLCYVRDGNKILLGMKKKGLGVGKWNGFGGKIENDESIEAAALREMREEANLVCVQLKKHAELTFIFPHKPEFDQVVHVFVTDKWEGIPSETDEMKPEWFSADKLPYNQMWISDLHFLPPVLAGKFVTAKFTWSPDGGILEQDITVK